jgi:prophage antirepressor-like protein
MQLTPFQFESHTVRVASAAGGETLFNANDVCAAIGLSNPRKAVADHVDTDDVTQSDITDRLGRTQQATFVTESGVYALAFGSRKPEAKAFKRWVTSEVLPQIRRTGSYGVTAPKDMIEALTLALEQAKQIEAQRAQIEAQRPAVEFVLAYVDDAELTISRRELAKLLRIKERELRALLLSAKVCYPNARGALLPFADQESCGRVGMKPYVNARTGHAGSQLFFSRKGHIHIAAKLAESRQIPLLPAGNA